MVLEQADEHDDTTEMRCESSRFSNETRHTPPGERTQAQENEYRHAGGNPQAPESGDVLVENLIGKVADPFADSHLGAQRKDEGRDEEYCEEEPHQTAEFREGPACQKAGYGEAHGRQAGKERFFGAMLAGKIPRVEGFVKGTGTQVIPWFGGEMNDVLVAAVESLLGLISKVGQREGYRKGRYDGCGQEEESHPFRSQYPGGSKRKADGQ